MRSLRIVIPSVTIALLLATTHPAAAAPTYQYLRLSDSTFLKAAPKDLYVKGYWVSKTIKRNGKDVVIKWFRPVSGVRGEGTFCPCQNADSFMALSSGDVKKHDTKQGEEGATAHTPLVQGCTKDGKFLPASRDVVSFTE